MYYFFYYFKISISNGLVSLFRKITSVWKKNCLAQKNQTSKAPISPLSHRFDNKNYKDPSGSNKLGLSEALARVFPVPPRSKALDVTRYRQKYMDHLLQTFLQASKRGLGDKLKAKSPNVYRDKSHMEFYNFVNSVKTILLPLKLPVQIEFCMQLLYFGTKSTFIGNNISGR